MKPLTDKQKKAAWIVALILIAVHFVPAVLHNAVQAVSSPTPHTRAAAPATGLSSPFASPSAPSRTPERTPEPTCTPQIAAPPPSEAQARYVGVWAGTEYLPNNDQCRMQLEIRPSKDQPGRISGFETRTCFNLAHFSAGKMSAIPDMLKESIPVTTIMTGTLEKGDIVFDVDKSIGNSSFQCPLASYTVSAFGEKTIVAQWRAVDCPAGQIVLTRSGG